MEIKTYYCDFCEQQTEWNPRGNPCAYCIGVLKSALQEKRDFNEIKMFGQIWKFPSKGALCMSVVMGEGKYVLEKMKRVARKAPSHA